MKNVGIKIIKPKNANPDDTYLSYTFCLGVLFVFLDF